jgi:hypothetical protein
MLPASAVSTAPKSWAPPASATWLSTGSVVFRFIACPGHWLIAPTIDAPSSSPTDQKNARRSK